MRTQGSGGAGVIILVIVLLLFLPIVYVLSLGPAVLLVDSELVSDEALEVVYAPLIVLHDACPPIGNLLEAYVELWESARPQAVPSLPPPPLPPPSLSRSPAPTGTELPPMNPGDLDAAKTPSPAGSSP